MSKDTYTCDICGLRRRGTLTTTTGVTSGSANTAESTSARPIMCYVFQCRPVRGVKEWFQVPIQEGIHIVDAAKARQNGFGKSIRYAMSHPRGKIEIVCTLPSGETVFKFHQSKDDADMIRPFSRVLSPMDTWLDENLCGV